MRLRSILEDVEPSDYTVATVGDDAPGALEELLVDTFDGRSIDVEPTPRAVEPAAFEGESPADETLAVLLEDGTPVATSGMSDLYESILAINSDLFVTGSRGLGEIELPAVLAGLDDTRLRLRGYPLAHKEKLLLIVVSRYIEQLAWADGSGTVRSSFQQLSRLEDELGTRRVYERLADTDLAVHVYGSDDTAREESDHDPLGGALEATVHTGDGPTYRDAWFVVYRPDGAATDGSGGAALVCFETEPRIWDGFFTFDPGRVARIDEAIVADL